MSAGNGIERRQGFGSGSGPLAPVVVVLGALVLGDVLFLNLHAAPRLLSARGDEQPAVAAGGGAEGAAPPAAPVERGSPGTAVEAAESAGADAMAPEPGPAALAAGPTRPVLPPPRRVPDLLFETGSAELSEDARRRLREVAFEMRARPELRLVLRGHADSRGEEDQNEHLSHGRAEAARRFLVEHGTESARVSVEALGEREPAVAGESASVLRRNRRVEVSWR